MMSVIKIPTSQVQAHQTVKMDHHLRKLLSKNARTIKKGHGPVVHQDVIIGGRPVGETVMGGDQDLVAEIEIDTDGQDRIVETETDVGGQDQAVKRDVDERQDPAVQTEEVATVPLPDNTEDHHPQDTG